MPNISDYLDWRGDLPFTADGLNEVDALFFACLSYLHLPAAMKEQAGTIPISGFAQMFFDQDNIDMLCVSRGDYQLLEKAVSTRRFGSCRMGFYRDILLEEDCTQFAAEVWTAPGMPAVIAFRGTDNTITGWKEDFRMSYCPEVPAQRMALEYAREAMERYPGNVVFTGHSKGGNLAIYAAAGLEESLQRRILAVYNMDGPGFHPEFLERPGYLRILPAVRTYLPQSSVVGQLLERREEPVILHSVNLGFLQHELHSWQVLGNHFELRDSLTQESLAFSDTVRAWVAATDEAQRGRVVEEIFDLIEAGEVKTTDAILKPAAVYKYLRTLHADDERRHAVSEDLHALVHFAAHHKMISEKTDNNP